MAFGSLKSEKELKAFNTFLENRSYVYGYSVSNADFDTLKLLTKAPAANLTHVLRWYNHLKSSEEEKSASACPLKTASTTTAPSPKKQEVEEEEDDVDLFGSDDDEEESEEAQSIREERLKAYNEKKSKKPVLIAKSSIVLDVKPWDDETDMKAMEKLVRAVEMDGLIWGASELVPVGYGINKLQIMCVVEDAKISIELLTEKIQEFEDYVQSTDIAAFNKI